MQASVQKCYRIRVEVTTAQGAVWTHWHTTDIPDPKKALAKIRRMIRKKFFPGAKVKHTGGWKRDRQEEAYRERLAQPVRFKRKRG